MIQSLRFTENRSEGINPMFDDQNNNNNNNNRYIDDDDEDDDEYDDELDEENEFDENDENEVDDFPANGARFDTHHLIQVQWHLNLNYLLGFARPFLAYRSNGKEEVNDFVTCN